MELVVEKKGKIVFVHIKGEFHIRNVTKFEEAWANLADYKAEVIAIDCDGLQYIDSSAIGTLVKIFNDAISREIKLVFYDLNSSIRNIFNTARLNNFFTITTKEDFEKKYLSVIPK